MGTEDDYVPSLTQGPVFIADLLRVGTDQKVAELCIWLGSCCLEDTNTHIYKNINTLCFLTAHKGDDMVLFCQYAED